VEVDDVTSTPLDQLLTRWRGEAQLLRAHGALEAAATKERDALEVEAAWQMWWTAELTVAEAVAECGYSADRLRELAREGKLPAARAADGELRVRRCDLPRRPGVRAPLSAVEDLAAKVLAGRR
jgi:hypothetical protein